MSNPVPQSPIYTPLMLAVYDFWVLGVSNRLAWKCPTSILRDHFRSHATDNHLDVGVGTGYFPDKCINRDSDTGPPRIALMDSSPHALEFTARRIHDLNPEIIQHDVLTPPPDSIPKFESVSMNYLLHCLPGCLPEKVRVFDNVANLLHPGAVVFGSTILGQGVAQNWLARKLANVYRKQGIFFNEQDSASTLQRVLNEQFREASVEVFGMVALFSARTHE